MLVTREASTSVNSFERHDVFKTYDATLLKASKGKDELLRGPNVPTFSGLLSDGLHFAHGSRSLLVQGLARPLTV